MKLKFRRSQKLHALNKNINQHPNKNLITLHLPLFHYLTPIKQNWKVDGATPMYWLIMAPYYSPPFGSCAICGTSKTCNSRRSTSLKAAKRVTNSLSCWGHNGTTAGSRVSSLVCFFFLIDVFFVVLNVVWKIVWFDCAKLLIQQSLGERDASETWKKIQTTKFWSISRGTLKCRMASGAVFSATLQSSKIKTWKKKNG